MENDQNPLLKACFELCAATMWEPDRLTAEQVQSHMEELDEMTNAYYEMAHSIISQLHGLPEPEQVMVSLVIYLKDSHAIPPLRGNIDWFKNSLLTLTELVNPQNAIRKSNLVFITHLQAGLAQLSQLIRTDEDLDQFSQV